MFESARQGGHKRIRIFRQNTFFPVSFKVILWIIQHGANDKNENKRSWAS